MLKSLHMPLVNNNHDLLVLRLIDDLEDVLISPINEDSLQLREEDVCALNVPVDEV
jgi:hypothetical protein